ncbi:MAG: hypothetical protein WBQ57_00635 [Rhodanobacteraceae bacterium]
MNHEPPTNEGPDRDEREIAALYRRLAKAEPDAALDARVLAEARRVSTSSRPSRSPRWLVGLGTAAVLVLAAGVTWHLNPLREAAHQQKSRMSAPSEEMRTQADSLDEPAPSPSGAATMERKRVAHSDISTAAENRAPRADTASPTAASAARDEKKPEVREALAAPAAGNAERAADSMTAAKAKTDHASPVAPAALTQPAPAPASPPPQTLKQSAASGMTDSAGRIAGPKPTAQALVDAARKALATGDRGTARKLVHTLRRDYPKFALPADLTPLAPAADKKGHHR